jgi:hypothetical protein
MKQLKHVAAKMPAPNRWPAWIHYLVMLLVFIAGVEVGTLWQMAPWSVLAFASIVALALYGLWSK